MTDESREKSPQEIEFDEWKSHPVTRRFFNQLRKQQTILMQQWAAGQFTDISRYGAATLNARAIGEYKILDRLLETDVSDLYEEDE